MTGGTRLVTKVVEGCRGPNPKSADLPPAGGFLSFIEIVSFWVSQKGMKAPGGAGYTLRCRHHITNLVADKHSATRDGGGMMRWVYLAAALHLASIAVGTFWLGWAGYLASLALACALFGLAVLTEALER